MKRSGEGPLSRTSKTKKMVPKGTILLSRTRRCAIGATYSKFDLMAFLLVMSWYYEPGKNGFPIEAGMLALMKDAFREMSTNTTMVAAYGIMERK